MATPTSLPGPDPRLTQPTTASSSTTVAPDPAEVHPGGRGASRSFPPPPMYGVRSADAALVDLAFLGRVCSRRMEGSTRKNTFVYYRCRPGATSGQAGHLQWPGHPKSFYVPEDKLVAGVLSFLADRVLGAHRRDLLAADLNETTNDVAGAWQEQLTAIERTLADLDGTRSRLLQALETTDDASGALAHDVNGRLTQIARADPQASGVATASARPARRGGLCPSARPPPPSHRRRAWPGARGDAAPALRGVCAHGPL